MAALSGIFVPNIVPYDAQGRINGDELRRIIRWLVGKGVTGFCPNGSMGEFWAGAKRVQFKLLDLFSLMVGAPNFPEGFRAGYELRGFKAGHARFPLSTGEQVTIETMRGRLACVLADAGFAEAAGECQRSESAPTQVPPNRVDVENIVREVMGKMLTQKK
jgi:dihydrodipicolinate synthase/N-acetylneuraminate lyase